MKVNRVFNWGPGNIPSDNPKPKEKSWLSKISDVFKPRTAGIPDDEYRKIQATTYRHLMLTSPGKEFTQKYETAALVVEKGIGIPTRDLDKVAFGISMGSMSGFMLGPIGISLKGLNINPAMSKISFRDPVVTEKVMANTILLMEESKDPDIAKALPDAAHEFIKRGAADSSNPERAKTAEKLDKIMDVPGSVEEKTNIAKFAIKIMEGETETLTARKASIKFRQAGTPASKAFADFLDESLKPVLAPITNQLQKASDSSTDKTTAILEESRKMAAGTEDSEKALLTLITLEMIENGKGPDASKASFFKEMMTKAPDVSVAAALSNSILESKSKGLNADYNSIADTGVRLCSALKNYSSDTANETLEVFFNYAIGELKDPKEKAMLEKGRDMASKLPPKGSKAFTKAYFKLIKGKAPEPDNDSLINIGHNTVKSMPTDRSSARQALIRTAQVFIEAASEAPGKQGKIAELAGKRIDSLNEFIGARFAQEVLTALSSDTKSAEKAYAQAGLNASAKTDTDYSSGRQKKTESLTGIMEDMKEITDDSEYKKALEGAIKACETTYSFKGYKNAVPILKKIAAGEKISAVLDLAKAFLSTVKPIAQDYSSERSNKTDTALGMLKALRDVADDPAEKKLLEKSIDLVDIIEEKLPDKEGNLTVSASGYRGHEPAQGILKLTAEGKTFDPGTEFGRLGYQFTRGMATDYSSERITRRRMAERFYLAIEKHADKPEQKKTAQAFREMMMELKDNAVGYVSSAGLLQLAKGEELSLKNLSSPALGYLNRMSEDYLSERKKKSEECTIIVKHLEKNAEKDFEKQILGAGRQVSKALESTGFGYRTLPVILKAVEEAEEDTPVTKILCSSGLNLLNMKFDSTAKANAKAKTEAGSAFLGQIYRAAESPKQKTLAQFMSLYCSKYNKENGYHGARAAFEVLSEMSEADEKKSMQDLVDRVKTKAPDTIKESLTKFMKSSMGSVYLMKESLDNVGEAAKDIEREEEFVVIGGVKLKKRK